MTDAGTSVAVLVVEDHELLAQTLRAALDAEGIVTDSVAPDSHGAILGAVEHHRPRVVLLDLELGPPVGDGTALIEPIAALGSEVLVVTGTTDRARVAGAVEAGAAGYRLKSVPFESLLAAVRDLLAGRAVLGDVERFELVALLRRRRTDEQARLAPFERLSPREQQVLRELAEGRSVESIARERRVSEATVRTQVRGILTKLGVGTQLAAVARARSTGWLGPPTTPAG